MFEDMLSCCRTMGFDIEVYCENGIRYADVYSHDTKLLTLHAQDSSTALNSISEVFFEFFSACVIPGKA